MSEPRLARRELMGLMALLVLAAGVRFYGLDMQSLWNDEGTSVALAQRSLATIAEQASQDIHPPLYYWLLHFWIKLLGTSEVAVRSLSAALGVLTVVGTWGLARALLDDDDGSWRAAPWLAGIFVALSPFQVYYAQEARMYMLVTCAGLASMWALVRLWRRQVEGTAGIGDWALYCALGIVAIYSHYFAFTLILAQNLAWLIWAFDVTSGERLRWPALWRLAWRWALAQTAILLAYLPWLLVSFGSLARWPAVAAPISVASLAARVARVFYVGIHYPPGRGALLVAGVAALFAVAGVLGRFSSRGTRWLTMLYASVPVACLIVLSLSRPMYKPKFLLLATPGYHILLGGGLSLPGDWLTKAIFGKLSVRPRAAAPWMLGMLLCIAPVWSLRGMYTNRANYRDDYRGIVAYISATAGPQDAILINAPSQVETVNYYYHGHLPEYPLPDQRPMDWPETEASLTEIMAKHRRVYAIYWATDESDPEGRIEAWMGARCYEAMDRWYGNLRLVVYAVPQEAADAPEQHLDGRLGDAIALDGFSILTPASESGSILQVTLHWRALAEMAERYKVFVHLLDARGNIVAQRDSEPVGGTHPTSVWLVGEEVHDNYGLLIPVGTPPGEYTLRVGMYHAETAVRLQVGEDQGGDHVDVGAVHVAQPAETLPSSAIDVQVRHDQVWAGVVLIGHDLYRLGHEHERELVLQPGDAMRIELYWRAGETGTAAPGWRLVLEDRRGNVALSQEILLGSEAYPADEWKPGELVRDVHQIQIPGDLTPGTWRLVLVPDTGQSLALQKVEIGE